MMARKFSLPGSALLSEIREVASVNPVSARSNRAADKQRVVYLRSAPSSISNELKDSV